MKFCRLSLDNFFYLASLGDLWSLSLRVNIEKLWRCLHRQNLKIQLFSCWILLKLQNIPLLAFLFFQKPAIQNDFHYFLHLEPISSNIHCGKSYHLIKSNVPESHHYGFMKSQEGYFGYRGNKLKGLHTWPTVVHPCFLSIQYVCDDHSLFIDLTDDYYLSGSEILSAEFILWWLQQHHPKSYNIPFHTDYQLHITDFNLNSFSIGFNESICLDATFFKSCYKIQLLKKAVPKTP